MKRGLWAASMGASESSASGRFDFIRKGTEGHGAKEGLGDLPFLRKVELHRQSHGQQIVGTVPGGFEMAGNHVRSSFPAGRGEKSLLVPFALSALPGLTGALVELRG